MGRRRVRVLQRGGARNRGGECCHALVSSAFNLPTANLFYSSAGMAKTPQESLPAARARLMALASATRRPRIIEVLRQLRTELVQCAAAGHSGSSILAALRAAGYEFSTSSFLEAWKTFRDENGLTATKTVLYTPRGTLPRTPVMHPPTITPGAKPPPGGALEALSRPSISQLLTQPTS